MFMGHYAAAFLARRAAPAVPLPVYFIACQMIDIFWGGLVLLDIEKLRVIPHFTATNGLDLYFMPYTHSLPAALTWSFVAMAMFWMCTRPAFPLRARTALVLGMTVASHWLLDLIVHIPDLPLWFNGAKVGLGLWNCRYPALLLELVLLWAGVLLALGNATANRRRYLVLALAMSGLQVLSLKLQPSLAQQVASHLLITYLALTAAAFWAGRPQPNRSGRAA